MIAFFLAIAQAAAPQTSDAPFPPDREVVFARGAQGPWSMEGRSVIDEGYPGRDGNPGEEPTIHSIYCSAKRNGIAVEISRDPHLGLVIDAAVTRNGREHRLSPFDLRVIILDGATWEVRSMSDTDYTERFSNVVYAGPEEDHRGSNIRQVAVRRPPGDVWLPVSTLADELPGAILLRLGFREEENAEAQPVDDDPLIWIDVPLDGLGEALGWCQRAMASPNALRLNPTGVAQNPPR